jgi:hypothetical protein
MGMRAARSTERSDLIIWDGTDDGPAVGEAERDAVMIIKFL